MARHTHHSISADGTVTNVYRDGGLTLVHTSVHRGGCLYLGEVKIRRGTDLLDWFSTTSAPWAADSTAPAAYLARAAG